MDEAMRDCENEDVLMRQQQGAAYKYPLSEIQSDNSNLQVPFIPVAGESVKIIGETSTGTIALSNYRIFIESIGINYNIPIGLIESCEVKDLFYLHIQCKEARTVRCTFSTNEICLEWFKRITRVAQTPTSLQDLFAFAYYAWTTENGDAEIISKLTGDIPLTCEQLFKKEVERLRFDTHGAWRITQANSNYRLCPSYPPLLLVPACVTDDTLEMVARFRSSRRIPVVVWRHVGNGAVIARCSQPEVGWLGWRSTEDEDLLKAMADACSFDRGAQSMLDVHLSLDSSPHSLSSNMEENALGASVPLNDGKKVLIMDARSYTTAVANRARGGGCECPEYYPSCNIEFMNLANIHGIRKSFHNIRQLCASPADQPNWFSLLESTRWLHHMSGLMKAATVLADAIEREGRPVLVHCSDGWDRTPQIVALGQILLDPYYRTIEGFRVLCEREWLDFGHKFADRCGHSVIQDDPNERCPVFLQWLDCIHQLINQYPCSFEFSQMYLVKLAKHTYSHMFGTFLCNSRQERESKDIYNNTFYVWPFLNDINFRNHLYTPPNENETVLWPSYNVRDLRLWSEMYLGSLEVDTTIENPTSHNGNNSEFVNVRKNINVNGETTVSMTKTRSYGDLKMAAETILNQPRRSSDPNILTDSIKLETLSLVEVAEKDTSNLIQSINLNDNAEPKEINHQVETSLNEIPESPKNDILFPTVTNGKESSKANIILHPIERNGKNESSNDSNTEYLKLVDNSKFEIDNNKHETVIPNSIVNGNSFETSTETIIPENNSSATPEFNNITNGADNNSAHLTSPLVNTNSEPNDNVDNADSIRNIQNGTCKMCTHKRKSIADKYRKRHYKAEQYYKNGGRYATTNETHTCVSLVPLDAKSTSTTCDLDGLTPLHSSIQNRLRQIVNDFKAKQDALERELHTTRMALIQQACRHCTNDSSETHDETCSVGGSVCSIGEGRNSANESLPSDVSWETFDEPCHIPDSVVSAPTLWVPDHAVSRCTGCHIEFWLGRRKHHCRNCGRIFCADCSENSTPLPNEQLYNPVRVCTSCFSELNLGANPSNLLSNLSSSCDLSNTIDQVPQPNLSYIGTLEGI